MAQGPSDTISVAIRITLRIRESKVRNPDPPDQRRFVLSEHSFLVTGWNSVKALKASIVTTGISLIIIITAVCDLSTSRSSQQLFITITTDVFDYK